MNTPPNPLEIWHTKRKNLKYMIIHSYLYNFHHNIRKNPQKYKESPFMAIKSHSESWDDYLCYKRGQILVKNRKKSNINTHSTVNIRQIVKKSWKSLNKIIINHPRWKLALNGLNLVVLLIFSTVRDFRGRVGWRSLRRS